MLPRTSLEHQIVDYEADHPSNDKDGGGGEEFALRILSCGTMKEEIEHKGTEADGYKRHGDEVHAERRTYNEA